jgi:hypothetical protein
MIRKYKEMHMADSVKPRFGLGTVVGHPHFGRGRIMAYERESYVVMFKGGETKTVAFSFEGLTAEQLVGDPEADRLKHVVREVLGDYG